MHVDEESRVIWQVPDSVRVHLPDEASETPYTCIYALRGKFPSVERRIRALLPRDVSIPALVVAELRLGAEKFNQAQRVHAVLDAFLSPFAVLPFDERCVRPYAAIRGKLEAAGQCIGPNDLIIAATALAHGSVLVTHNADEFRRVEGLVIDDWVDPESA